MLANYPQLDIMAADEWLKLLLAKDKYVHVHTTQGRDMLEGIDIFTTGKTKTLLRLASQQHLAFL